MAQLTDSCFTTGEALLPLDQALALLAQNLQILVGQETVALAHLADRILADDIIATHHVPPHDNSAVDGYAIDFEELSPTTPTPLKVETRITAGQFLNRPINAGEAIRIFTGAPMPAGADTVMMQEDCTEKEGVVTLLPGLKKGANRRKAGEDMAKGDVVLKAGQRLGPVQIAVAAAQGLNSLKVYKKLKIALFSSGDEVNNAGTPLPAGGIYDANRPMLYALLNGWGCDVTDLGILPDDPIQMKNSFLKAAEHHDLLVSSAGMSVGEEDHLCQVIKENGSLNFWKLAIKPGRPVGLGLLQINGKSTPILGLPGNPVAAFLTCALIGRALVQKTSGQKISAPLKFTCALAEPYKKKAGPLEYVRATLITDIPLSSSQHPIAKKFGVSGAAILSSLQGADGFILLDADVTDYKKGDLAFFHPMEGLLKL